MKKKPEPVYYFLSNKWYKGQFPVLYDPTTLPGTKVLTENYELIKSEVLSYLLDNMDSLKPNFTPYDYQEEGWKTINLYSYFLKYPANCNLFPETTKLMEQVPGMCGAQIAVLKPGTRIKAHLGDTNAIIRSHLGILIPGDLPELGFRIGTEEICWKEGGVFSFCIVHRHYAWNYSSKYRVMFQLDVIHPEYYNRRFEIASKTLALISMKLFATRFPAAKKISIAVTSVIQWILHWPFRFLLYLQRVFGVDASRIFGGVRSKKIG
ncbi:MAG: aspartyl/asparaginyl beta-hydroxylase domain-containing protein [Flavobacteriales bacterium]|nr:aspartyl/asparaginyl beta-hydroxylase domain-containing protein [Flavobacteriales bacterium]MCB9190259.1 aspartyl/asparaginyl beta-hydroxylase domain-containing protein [Flavobacteriales bacterium]